MKKQDVSETTAVCDLKLIDLMKMCEYLTHRLDMTLAVDRGCKTFTQQKSDLVMR